MMGYRRQSWNDKSVDVPYIALWILKETPWNFCSVPQEIRHSAIRFFSKALAKPHISSLRVITVYKFTGYPNTFKELKAEGTMPFPCELSKDKYLNNLVEQDHRFMKRLVFIRDCVAYLTMLWVDEHDQKGQMLGMDIGDILGQVTLIVSVFGVASYDEHEALFMFIAFSKDSLQHNFKMSLSEERLLLSSGQPKVPPKEPWVSLLSNESSKKLQIFLVYFTLLFPWQIE